MRDLLRSRLVLVSRGRQCQRAIGMLLEQYDVPTSAAQQLVWVPGIGRMVAYPLRRKIDDLQRFPSVRHVHSYRRFVPGSHDAGGTTRHQRSRGGKRALKMACHHAAIRAIPYVPELKAEYQRWQRRKFKPIARALIAEALATKRCTWPIETMSRDVPRQVKHPRRLGVHRTVRHW